MIDLGALDPDSLALGLGAGMVVGATIAALIFRPGQAAAPPPAQEQEQEQEQETDGRALAEARYMIRHLQKRLIGAQKRGNRFKTQLQKQRQQNIAKSV